MKLYTDALTRKKWITKGLVQRASTSFWAPYTGNTDASIVFTSTNLAAKHGHITTFDYDGQLSGKAIKGKNTAYGKGEQKKKFSSTIVIERYRIPVDNGDKFDGIEFGDLDISQHQDSRRRLSDLYIRFKDQIIFDAAQGNLRSRTDGSPFTPSHTIDISSLGYNDLIDIETTLKTSQNYTSGGMRRPLPVFRTAEGKPMWLFIVDALTAAVLKKDPNYQALVSNADYRGNRNRIISQVIGKLGNLIIVEADNYFGETNPGDDWGIDDVGIEIAGLRTKDANGVWAGQEGYDPAAGLISRCLILGAGAIQLGFGMMPDYKFKSSEDFDITSESALEVWLNVQKTKLVKENADYSMAKVTDLDWGVIAVNVTHA